MICPKCKGNQHCPCKNCSDKNRGKTTWKWITENGPIECGHCGHTMSYGDWCIEEFKQYDQWKNSHATKKN